MLFLRKEIFHGIAASLLLLTAYVALLYFLNGYGHVLQQFREFGFLIIPLIVGFGIQVGLFSFVRTELKAKASAKEMAASGSVSAGSMIACCAHHITDILPFLGASGFFLFLGKFTVFFLVLGVLSNIVGIATMIAMMQKHDLLSRKSGSAIAKKIAGLNWNVIRTGTIIVSCALLLGLFLFTLSSASSF